MANCTNKADILFSRRSKFYSANINTWRRTLAAYAGGRPYIRKALIPHVAENKLEFGERLQRAIYLNIPRKITNMVCEFLFSSEPDRESANKDIVSDFSRTGLSANYLMQQAEIVNFMFGLCWILIDYPVVKSKVDLESKQKQKIRPFARVLLPHVVKDWAFDSDGGLKWVLIEEKIELKDNPFEEAKDATQYRLWTKTDWSLYQKSDKGTQLLATGKHNLGIVPVVRWIEPAGYGLCSQHWFEDVVGISDAILNELSEAQMNTIKQMFGILVVSQAFAEAGGFVDRTPRPGETEEQAKARAAEEEQNYRFTLSRATSIWETAEENGLTRYISPIGTETKTIIEFVQFLQSALNDVLRMALTSSSKAAQTAESKSWDSHNAQQFFAARAGMLEEIETKIWEIMHLWDKDVAVPKISYNREFSITDIQTAVTCLMDLSSFDVDEEFTREVYDKALVLLDRLDRIPQERYKKIKDKIAEKVIEMAPKPMKVDDLLSSMNQKTQQKGNQNENHGNPQENQ